MAQLESTVSNIALTSTNYNSGKMSPIITTTPASSTTSSNTVDSLQRLRGLTNIGNTCFFNAVMQCLGQTPFLSTIFNNEVVLPGGIFKTEEGGEKNMPEVRIEYYSQVEEIIPAFKDILDELQKSGGVHNPVKFFNRFSTLHPQFGGGDQHDSHELLRHLLDAVIVAERHTYRKLLMRALFKGRKFKNLTTEEKQTLESYANQSKDRYLIERVFQGSLESTLQCADCAHTSPNMEKFLDISLPISVDPPKPSTSMHTYGRQRSSPEPAPALTKRQLKKEKRKTKREKKYGNRTDNENTAMEKSNENSDNSDSNDENSDNSSTELDNGKNESDEDLCKNFEVSITISCKGKSELLKKHSVEKTSKYVTDNGFTDNKLDEKDNTNAVADATIASENNNLTAVTADSVIENNVAAPIASDNNGISVTEADKSQTTNDNSIDDSLTKSATTVHPSITIGPPYVPKEFECSVQSCLSAFTATELMSGNNKVGCEECTKRINGEGGKTINTNATKQFLISSLPAVLILHLKRFQIGPRHSFRKLATHVTFPVTLDMGPFCAASPQISKKYRTVNRKQKKILYSLYGVVEHSGGMHGGHYVAYVKVRPKLTPDDPRWKFVSKLYNEQRHKNQGDTVKNGYDSDDSVTSWPDEENVAVPPGKWYYVSDSRVSEVPEERVLSTQAYLLFYERIY